MSNSHLKLSNSLVLPDDLADVDIVFEDFVRNIQSYTNEESPVAYESDALSQADQAKLVYPDKSGGSPLDRLTSRKSALGKAFRGQRLQSAILDHGRVILARIAKPTNATNQYKCSLCPQSFPVRKSLLRHLRTVHQAKAFFCPPCDKAFIRKDTLDRHIAEQHSDKATTVTCMACGRHVGERTFHEHLDSQVCNHARALIGNDQFDGLQFKYPGQDDDAFLVTVRMFLFLQPSLSFPLGTRNAELKSDLFVKLQESRDEMKSQQLVEWYESYDRALILMKEQMANDFTALHTFGALWCTALLLAIMSIAEGCGASVLSHFMGAEAMLTARHGLSCSCDGYLSCRNWRRPTLRDPVVALVGRLLDERGIAQSLKSLYQWVWEKAGDVLEFPIPPCKSLDFFAKTPCQYSRGLVGYGTTLGGTTS